ncbi:hypothetical protein DY000_02049345 [Brassica cretica]|uniref:Uncharacterized protein n=1 Tax=Brassica cretica TaxID=69181 RepID=A0ABQ7F637_BRACR|nr:hypothetical protein DY000_02049345 [Brassica cretica]
MIQGNTFPISHRSPHQSTINIEVPGHESPYRVIIEIKGNGRLAHFPRLVRSSCLSFHRVRTNRNWLPLLPNPLLDPRNRKISVSLIHAPSLPRILDVIQIISSLREIQSALSAAALAIIPEISITLLKLPKLVRELVTTSLHYLGHLSPSLVDTLKLDLCYCQVNSVVVISLDSIPEDQFTLYLYGIKI